MDRELNMLAVFTIERFCKLTARRVEKETGCDIEDFLWDVALNHSGETFDEITSAIECEADNFIDFHEEEIKKQERRTAC